MSPLPHVPLRRRLFLLAAVAIVPLAAMSGLGLLAMVQQHREQAERAGLDVTRALATAVDAELRRSTAVLGGGVGPENAAEHVRRAGAEARLMVLLGSRAYAYPGGVEEGVRAAVEAVRT